MDTPCAHAQAACATTAGRWVRAAAVGAALTVSTLGAAQAATPAGTTITNVATVRYSVGGNEVRATGSVSEITTSKTPATIEYMQYVGGLSGLPNGTVVEQNVQTTQCNKTGSGYVTLDAPTPPGASTLAIPSLQALSDSALYASGDIVFVRVVDYDRNVDPNVAEIIEVTVTSSGGDSEQLKLKETGPSTGVFLGYIRSVSGPAVLGDCLYNIGGNQELVATYIDESESSVAITAAALVDPLGVVFDSVTGQPVDGAQVTLMDVTTGKPAAVKGNDGLSTYPSTVTTGSTVVDSGGTRYVMGAGRYQFPRVNPGTYRLDVATPAGYSAPSTVTDAVIATLPNGPFTIVTGSRGEVFGISPGPALVIDIPVDPGKTDLAITKSVNKSVVGVGEYLGYTITIRNNGASAMADVRIADRLPLGLRYQKGSTRLDGQTLADPTASNDGRNLVFSLGTLSGGASVTLRYVTLVTASAPKGVLENTAQASNGYSSNVAKASVTLRDDINSERIILAGRVTLVESCRDDEKDPNTAPPLPLKGVRVMLQDGTYVVTDLEGRWHLDNLRAGTHVVQIDETTMPQEFQYEACEQNSRTGGRNFSQFVNVRPGSLWRADFRYMRVASCMNQQLQVQGRQVQVKLEAPVAHESMAITLMLPKLKVVPGSVKLDGQPLTSYDGGDGYLVVRQGRHATRWRQVLSFELDQEPTSDLTLAVQLQPPGQPSQRLPMLVRKGADAQQCAVIALPTKESMAAATTAAKAEADSAASGQSPAAKLQLVEQLPYDDRWVAAAPVGVEWLHPQTSFVPALPAIKAALKHRPGDVIEFNVNGKPVDPIRYEGSVSNPANTVAVSQWHAVELRDGANEMEMVVRNAQGQEVLREKREIHYVVGPQKALFDPVRSTLVADGRSAPVLALRMLDRNDKPVRKGVNGEFLVRAPYVAQSQMAGIQSEPLTGNLGGKPRYSIGEDGIALIRLQPTTQAGEVVLDFDFGGDRKQEVRVWLQPDMRDWVLVGFAQGTLAHKTLSGNLESLSGATTDRELFDGNRLAFYAKGQVKGEYLLTAAYDTSKERGGAGATALRQAVDPTKYYTLYADASQGQYDAASIRKLYLKIEKSQFYALFGDFDTGLTVSDLGRYSRTLNGLKTEYKGQDHSISAFASMTSQSYGRDEIQGQGISGLYRLSMGNVLVGSDKVRLEVRDRMNPATVLRQQDYVRYIDYQIDYDAGTLQFREPIVGFDGSLNPVYIVAEYESDSKTAAKLTYGGRAAARVGDKGEVGVTHLHEGTVGSEATLTAVDLRTPLSDTTKLHLETARSQRNGTTGSGQGSAYVAELEYSTKDNSATVYARNQDLGFGLGQQTVNSSGNRKVGATGVTRLNETTQLQGQVYRENKETSAVQAERQAVEASMVYTEGDLMGRVGLRLAEESDTSGLATDIRQVLLGTSYALMDRQLTLRAAAEIDMGSQTTGTSSVTDTVYPNRIQVGADYLLTPETSLLTTHELAWAQGLRANATRVGLRTRPWTGVELAGSLGSEIGTDTGRTFAEAGLVQKWQLDEQWFVDAGLSRMHTLSGTTPSTLYLLSTGGNRDSRNETGVDYTAISVGSSYKEKEWSANGRLEWRLSTLSTKVHMVLGAQRALMAGRTVSGLVDYTSADYRSGQSAGTAESKFNLRVNYAYRPTDALGQEWMWLNRLDYVQETQSTTSTRLQTRKLIDNFNANWQPDRRTQIALQYSGKYVFETIDSSSYKGYTDLMGFEARFDLNNCWDVGMHASTLSTWADRSRKYHAGVSTGYKMAENVWLSVGYNMMGFNDPDFSGAQYRAKGFYIALRAKFDQDTFGLNERRPVPVPLQP